MVTLLLPSSNAFSLSKYHTSIPPASPFRISWNTNGNTNDNGNTIGNGNVIMTTALHSSTVEEETTAANTKHRRDKSRKYKQKKNKDKNGHENEKVTTKARTYKDIKEFKQARETIESASVGRSKVPTKNDGGVNADGVGVSDDYDHGQGYDKYIDKDNGNSNGNDSSSNSKSTEFTQDAAETDAQTNSAQDHAQQRIKKRIRNIHNIRSSRTSEELERSSQRMNKAQLLLEDLSTNATMQNLDSNPSSPSSPTMDMNMDATDATATATATVPDAFWYNGNLQSGQGDYVTRWARGVKVAEPLRKYDPLATEKLLFLQPAKWIVRNVQIAIPLATWALGVATDVVTNKEEANRKNRAKQLLNTISGLGPAIIKGGQALASRSDLMPSEYLDQLQKLQDDVPRFANELALATVEEELNVKFDDVFELMDPEPIAAASIGQVYKARLRSNGDLVALKIQRPKCEEIIALDLYVLRWWSGVANGLTKLLNRDINVQSIIDDFGELIYRELDYVAEAANAQRFSELYAGQVKDVFVPKVYSELTTSKVLTMEWVEGFRLTDSEKLKEYGLDSKKLVDTLVQCSLRQILGNGELDHLLLSVICSSCFYVFLFTVIGFCSLISLVLQAFFTPTPMLEIFLLSLMVVYVIWILE